MDKSFTMLTRKYFHNIFNPILFFSTCYTPLRMTLQFQGPFYHKYVRIGMLD